MKRSLKALIPLTASLVLIASCSNSRDMATTLRESKAHQVSIGDMVLNVGREAENLPINVVDTPAYRVDLSEYSSDKAIFEISTNDPKMFFGPGKYGQNFSSYGQMERQFLDAVRRNLTSLVQNSNIYKYDYQVHFEYRGMSDASRLRNPLIYGGEIGTLSDIVTIGSLKKHMIFNTGDSIKNNHELAYMRIAFIRRLVEDIASTVLPKEVMNRRSNDMIVDESEYIGRKYRSATVRIEIKHLKPTS